MSYCSIPRLSFTGKFQADVSTVNNDVRHYDNTTFQLAYQTTQQTAPNNPNRVIANGWWNPDGTGAFRLVDVDIKQALLSPDPSTDDPAVGLTLNAQIERSAAKLVDLDPQFQMGSMIFGMRIALVRDGVEYLRGTVRPMAFRDIYFGRSPAGGSGGASAKFTSVLTGVEFTADADASPVLMLLKEASHANEDTLTINLMTYGFVGQFPFLGLISGSIGTWTAGDPKSFIAGRRFAAVGPSGTATPEGIGYFDGDVTDTVSLDLGNALPLSQCRGEISSVGPLIAAVLKTPDEGPAIKDGRLVVNAGIAQGAEIGQDDFVELGQIDYLSPGWLQTTAGIADFAVPQATQGIIGDHPLALVSPVANKPGTFKVMIRETIAGLFLRADDFEARMDPPTIGRVAADRTLYARRYGQALPDAPVTVGLLAKQSGGGGGYGFNQPTAPIPDVNWPSYAVRVRVPRTTGRDGAAPVTFHAADPRNPRGYIDGQIYMFSYVFDIDGGSPMPQLDLFVLHVRDAVDVPDQPDWGRDIGPFMQQYDNLYPVMSHDLFSLSDPKVAEQHARLLSFAFERDIDDPNHMPATRDLSEGRRRTILRWLSQFIPDHEVAPADMPLVATADEISDPPPKGRLQPLSQTAIHHALSALGDATDGKTQAMRDFLSTQRTA